MADLYVMVGIPGMGKSTFVRNHKKETDVHASRDRIRFQLVKPGEGYFSKEKEVYKLFIKEIEDGLKANHDVYADATHLNRPSRNKLLNTLNKSLYNHVYAVYIKGHLSTALERNEERKGSTAYVPREQIRRMAYSLEEPSVDERFDKIYIIENDKLSTILRRELL